ATAKQGETIAHGHAGDGDRARARGDIEDAKLRRAAGGAPFDGQVAGPWSRNRQVFVDNQLTAAERNGAQAVSEVNRGAGQGSGNSITQRSGADIARVRDCDCVYSPGSPRQQNHHQNQKRRNKISQNLHVVHFVRQKIWKLIYSGAVNSTTALLHSSGL